MITTDKIETSANARAMRVYMHVSIIYSNNVFFFHDLAWRLHFILLKKLKVRFIMPISFDHALGIHQQALAIRSQRAELLASNIANADTPGYKARDIDFRSVLENSTRSHANTQSADSLTRTDAKHIQLNTGGNIAEVLYRVPNQSALDGNTVDGQMEKSAFADNALRYQASLAFLDGKFKGLLAAIKGE